VKYKAEARYTYKDTISLSDNLHGYRCSSPAPTAGSQRQRSQSKKREVEKKVRSSRYQGDLDHVQATPSTNETNLQQSNPSTSPLALLAITTPQHRTNVTVPPNESPAEGKNTASLPTDFKKHGDLWEEAYKKLQADQPKLFEKYKQVVLNSSNDRNSGTSGQARHYGQ
jgi:hypothetical protein